MARPAGDPDALWKPGYDGPWHVPEPDLNPGTPGAGRVGPTARQLAVSALLGLVVIGVLVLLLGRDPGRDIDPPAGDRDRVPVDVWSATFPTIRIGALTVTDEVLLALIDRPGSVVALDRRDGGLLWQGSAPGVSATGLDVVDGVVLSRHVEADGTGSAVAHDLDSGILIWRSPLAVGERIDVIEGVPWLRTSGVTGAVPLTARDGPAVRVPAVPLPSTGGPTDHLLRGMAPGAETEIAVPGATVRVVVDGATGSMTIVHRRDGAAGADDPSPDTSASVP